MEVGDYIRYIPDNTKSTYNLKAIYSGYSSDQIIDNSYDPQSWRIMEIDENRNVTKLLGISSKAIGIGGSVGYNNGVYLLNDICKSRYENTSLEATARSLNIEDIEAQMNTTGIATRNAYKSGSVQYGTTRKYTNSYTKYPAIYAQEKYSGIGISDVADGTQIITGNLDNIALKKMNPNGKSESNNIYEILPTISDGIVSSSINLTCTQTYYYFNNTPNSYFDDTNFYNIIFKTGTRFWIASRFSDCNSNYSRANFGIRLISGSILSGTDFYQSNDNSFHNLYFNLAIVISLNSITRIKSGNGTINNSYIIGQ